MDRIAARYAVAEIDRIKQGLAAAQQEVFGGVYTHRPVLDPYGNIVSVIPETRTIESEFPGVYADAQNRIKNLLSQIPQSYFGMSVRQALRIKQLINQGK